MDFPLHTETKYFYHKIFSKHNKTTTQYIYGYTTYAFAHLSHPTTKLYRSILCGNRYSNGIKPFKMRQVFRLRFHRQDFAFSNTSIHLFVYVFNGCLVIYQTRNLAPSLRQQDCSGFQPNSLLSYTFGKSARNSKLYAPSFWILFNFFDYFTLYSIYIPLSRI